MLKVYWNLLTAPFSRANLDESFYIAVRVCLGRDRGPAYYRNIGTTVIFIKEKRAIPIIEKKSWRATTGETRYIENKKKTFRHV